MKPCLFTLTLNLQRIVTVRLAVWLWEQNRITKKVNDLFALYDERIPAKRKYEWEALTKEVIQSVPEVPGSLRESIILTVRSVGRNLYNFYSFIKYKNVKYGAVCWTHYGCIDERPLFRDFCKQVPFDGGKFTFWFEYQKMSWLKSNASFATFAQSGVDENFPNIPMSMLKTVLGQGIYVAVKHFWNGMDDEEKYEIAEVGLRFEKNIALYNVDNYVADRFTELGTFLIGAVTDSQRDRLLRRYRVLFVFKLWLTRWPWIEQLVPTLASMWPRINKPTYSIITEEIITAMKNDFYSGYAVKDSLNQRILRQIWEGTPADLKKSIPYGSMATLISIYDYASYELISKVFEEGELLTEHEKFLDSIREAHNTSDSETSELSTCFENKMDTLGLYLNISQYELADKLMDWKSCTEEEKKEFMYFEPLFMYMYFISEGKQFEAEKVFHWRFTVRD